MQMCMNDLPEVALDSAAAGTKPAISSRKSNAVTTTPPNHTREKYYQNLHVQILNIMN